MIYVIVFWLLQQFQNNLNFHISLKERKAQLIFLFREKIRVEDETIFETFHKDFIPPVGVIGTAVDATRHVSFDEKSKSLNKSVGI